MSVRFESIGKRLLAAFLVLIAFLGLFSCQEEDPAVQTVYTVEFSASLLPYTAETPAAQNVKEGDRVSEPTLDVTPTAGYVVIWTTDVITRTPYAFSAAVNADLLLYAVEVPRTNHVTYLIEKGTNSSKNPAEFTAETPTFKLYDPILKNGIDENGVAEEDYGYRFYNWSYADDPNSVVTEIPQGTEGDVLLRAVFRPRTFKVQYSEGGDENPNPTSYRFGDVVSLKTPLREGYVFKGYTIYMDAGQTPVTALTPQFVKEHAEALTYASGYGNWSDLFLQANWEKVS